MTWVSVFARGEQMSSLGDSGDIRSSVHSNTRINKENVNGICKYLL